jgi:4,5-DOPA dioxygenase extradiol
MRHPAPGAPELAAAVIRLLSESGIEARADAERGFDHGVWVPLRFVLPGAATPTIALSLPFPRDGSTLVALGRALAALREQGVMILGSGGVVHNLRRIDFAAKGAVTADWARAFDAWAAERIAAKDALALADYRRRAPTASLAAPTSEHYDPLLVAVAATRPSDRVETLFEGFQYGTLSMRSVAFAA